MITLWVRPPHRKKEVLAKGVEALRRKVGRVGTAGTYIMDGMRLVGNVDVHEEELE